MRSVLASWILLCAIGLFSLPARADGVNFEDQPPGPGVFAAAGPTQTLVYNFLDGVQATFAGGVILTNEVSQTTDNSNVYATASFGDASLTNPLTVTFNQTIHNFQIDILNAIAGNYTMADNVGDSIAFTLATTGGSLATEGFAAAGTQVTITYNGPGVGGTAWDFAIDNVTFNQPLGTKGVPEPSSILMLGSGLLGLMALSFRKAIA